MTCPDCEQDPCRCAEWEAEENRYQADEKGRPDLAKCADVPRVFVRMAEAKAEIRRLLAER